MDRLFPEREDMGWESGWAFYSGDEGDVYGEGDEYYESHCGFYVFGTSAASIQTLSRS